MVNTTIRKANSDDVKDILRLLIELAIYEKEPDAVKSVSYTHLTLPTKRIV